MIPELPAIPEPQWLAQIAADPGAQAELPLQGILENSLYYPAAGLDGDPIAYLAGNFLSFILVDYVVQRKTLDDELAGRGFIGYSVYFRRSVTRQELVPNGWAPTPPRPGDGDPRQFLGAMAQPYCEWIVFQRDRDRPEAHGPRRFSLLYLCADGVASFQALYGGNGVKPAAVAIIQPGTGFGLNWTDFADPNQILARSVRENAAGQPDVLLFGGAGGRNTYMRPCWPEYAVHVSTLGDTSIHVWRRA